jgi:hypothetical protein
MLTQVQQRLNGLPDRRAATALFNVFDSMLPDASDTNIVANVGNSQVTATALNPNKSFHIVKTVAVAANGIRLPPALSGAMHFVANSGANAMQVYGAGTDTINSVATATGVSQAAASGVWYVCMLNGNWVRS